MNLSPIVDAIGALAAAVITTCTPIITLKVTTWLGVKMDTEHRMALNAALQNGLGIALKYGQDAGDHALSNVVIKNASVSAAVAYVNANAGDAVSYFGLTDAGIAEKVGAQLATLLHVTNTAAADNVSTATQTSAMLSKVAEVQPAPPPPTSVLEAATRTPPAIPMSVVGLAP
jgi:hypothetical protein